MTTEQAGNAADLAAFFLHDDRESRRDEERRGVPLSDPTPDALYGTWYPDTWGGE